MKPDRNEDRPSPTYGDEEGRRRTETALRAAFKTPHKTYEESKVGKPRAKRRGSLGKRKPVKKPAS
jgi:hypothetical protein